jgi:RimJ/RimL family protein N-acetyltransferase
MSRATALAPGEWFQVGIAEPRSDDLIGDIGIRVAADERTAEIGFSMNPRFQRRGLAGEAVRAAVTLIFEVTGVDEVIAITDARNLAARTLLAAIGMVQLGTHDASFRGQACIEHTFAVTRGEHTGGRRS